VELVEIAADDVDAAVKGPAQELRMRTGRPVRGEPLRRALTAGTLAWMFGNVWFVAISGSAFTLFVKSMRASPFQFGLLTSLQYLAALVSIPASLLIERTGQRRKFFFWGHYFQRAMWAVLALAPLWVMSRYGVSAAHVALNLFIPLLFLMYAGGAVGGPGWVSWMADVVPARVRGRYFSRRRQWSVLTALPAAWFTGWLLDRYGGGVGGTGVDTLTTMRWCAIIFLCAACFGVMDIVMFQLVPDVPKAPQRGAGLLRAMARPLKDKNYLWFAGYIATLQFAFVPMAQFLTLYAMDKASLNNRDVQLMMLVLPMVAQLIVLPVWGLAADRMGKKPLLVVATLGLVPVGLGWCLMTGGSIWIGYVLASLGTALWTGVEVANLNLVLGMSGSAEDDPKTAGGGGTAYHAVNSVILAMAAVIGGLAWGGIAQGLKDWHWTPVAGWKTLTAYDVLFVLSGGLRLVAVVVFLPHIHEPDARPTREALRFMGANIYNNLFGAMMQPLRMMRLGKSETYEVGKEREH
jgi:MFS family permease